MKILVPVGTALGSLALALLSPGVAHADPVNGGNATPGTLSCASESGAATSGSDLAGAVQFLDSSQVLVVMGSVEFPDWQRGHVPSSKIVSCTLTEESLGGSVTVLGLLTGHA